MSIARTDIANYLHAQFSGLAAAIGQTDVDDSATGYGPDVDEALRELGKSESELGTATVKEGQRKAAFALASYFAARRFWRRLGDRVNHTMGETKFDFADQRKSAKEMMEDAAAECASLGYAVRDEWSSGWLNLDWSEPNAIGL